MLHYQYASYTLHFAFKALTSRGALPLKPTWFVRIWDDEQPELKGYGEIALFQGLSVESAPDFEKTLYQALAYENSYRRGQKPQDSECAPYPSSIMFGLESAALDLANRQNGYSQNDWISGEDSNIINGLIWMGDFQTMLDRIKTKLDEGFQCLKLKIGGIDFESECQLLAVIRKHFSKERLVIRLDANGSFTPENALERLDILSKFDIHSIEQPIRQGQWEQMRWLCKNSPIDIALDEELIGQHSDQVKRQMLKEIQPKYIILKPSLCGGLHQSQRWVEIGVKEFNIGLWYTSALETNVGLRAVAQTAYGQQERFEMWMPQGLGTGEVFTNNIPSGIYRRGQELWYDPKKDFNFDGLGLNWIEP